MIERAIKVGDVVQLDDGSTFKDTYKITKVESRHCWGVRRKNDGTYAEEEPFGELNEYAPRGWGRYWTIIEAASEPRAAAAAPVSDISDWRAWRDVNRGLDECPCGIHRSRCEFHR